MLLWRGWESATAPQESLVQPETAASRAAARLGVSVIEPREFQGRWWRPEDETRKLPGKLIVSRGEAELHLLGDFGHKMISGTSTHKVFDPLRLDEPHRLVGESVAKEKITLEGLTVGSPGDISVYRFPWTLVGKTFGAEEEIHFDEVLVRLSDLDTWSGASGFRVPGPDPEAPEGGLWRHFDISFERPDSIEIELDAGERASIEFGAEHSGWTPVTTSVTITQDTALRLRFDKPHRLHEVARRVSQLRYFLTLAVGRAVTVLSVTGYQDRYRSERLDHAIPIELLWGIPHNPEPPTEKRHPVRMPFTLERASGAEGIGAMLKRWFAMQERYRPVFNLYFGVRYHPDLYLDLRFLAFAQAIETFHSRRGSEGRTLEQRMRSILSECPTISTKFLEASGTTLDEFATVFSDTRDYYTHYNPRTGSQAVRGIRLYVLAVQLQALIEMLLFRELGFSCDEIDAIFTTPTPRYREIKNAQEQTSDEGASAVLE